jgi:hypothetical protein
VSKQKSPPKQYSDKIFKEYVMLFFETNFSLISSTRRITAKKILETQGKNLTMDTRKISSLLAEIPFEVC